MRSPGIDFYLVLSKRGLTPSLRHYSSHYLGMAANYACIRGDRPPSAYALLNLFSRLWEEQRILLAVRVAYHILFRACGATRHG
jgi:hypothetical protein